MSMESIDMAKAYIAITEEMGPSEQLLAFVNFDGGLKEEIGLETFDSLSWNARHEILLAQLKKTVAEHDEAPVAEGETAE